MPDLRAAQNNPRPPMENVQPVAGSQPQTHLQGMAAARGSVSPAVESTGVRGFTAPPPGFARRHVPERTLLRMNTSALTMPMPPMANVLPNPPMGAQKVSFALNPVTHRHLTRGDLQRVYGLVDRLPVGTYVQGGRGGAPRGNDRVRYHSMTA